MEEISFFGDDALDELFGDREPPVIPAESGGGRRRRVSSPAKRSAAKRPQGSQGSITPLTCADINYLPSDATGFVLNHHRASLVSLVGSVWDSNSTGFILDDRTGWIQCSWTPLDESCGGQKLHLKNGEYARVIGKIEREVLPSEFGDVETGGFLINVLHCERLESINAIADHMLQTTRAKLAYITEDARHCQDTVAV